MNLFYKPLAKKGSSRDLAVYVVPFLVLFALLIFGTRTYAVGGHHLVIHTVRGSTYVSQSPLAGTAGTGATVSTALAEGYLSFSPFWFITGLSNIFIPIQYTASVYDNGNLVGPNSQVRVGDSITFRFNPHQSTDVSWFGTVDTLDRYAIRVSTDSPYGNWGANTSCSAANYVTSFPVRNFYGSIVGQRNIYIPFDVAPPPENLALQGSGVLGGSGCGSLSPGAGGGYQTTCTVINPGNAGASFNFGGTNGGFFGYYENVPYYGGLSTGCTQMFSSPSYPVSVPIPAMSISYPLTATNPTQPPATPTLSCPASVPVGQPAAFSVSATDPSGLQLRYGMDWLGSSPVPNAWVPSSGYVNSGVTESVNHTWTVPGTYSVRALAQNTSGESSGWSPSCSVTVTSPPTASLTGNGCVLPAGGGTCNISLHWTASGTHNNLVDLGLTLPNNSVLLGILTLVDTAGNTTHPASFLGLPADPSMTVPAGTPGTYAFKMYDNGTTNQIGSTLPLVACPAAYTLDTTNETCVPPPLPHAKLSATPSTIDSGQTTKLSWSSTNATSCTAAGGFSTGGATSGGPVTVGPLTSTATYGITCVNAAGAQATDLATVTVRQPTVTITASPARVVSPGSTTVSWNATNVNSCSITRNGQSWLGPFTANSSRVVSGNQTDTITSDTTYTISCTNNASASATAASATQIVTVVPQFAPF